MKIIDRKKLDSLSRAARDSARRRLNLNLHEQDSDPCQRLFNALEPNTYVRPHRHLDPSKTECFVAVRGRMALIVFNDAGDVRQVVPFGDGSDTIAVDLSADCWHSLISLAPGSIFFEVKTGPYDPLTDKHFASWAPEEGSPQAGSYLASLLAKASENV